MKTNRKPPTAVSTVRNRERGSTFLTFLLSTLIVLATYGYCYAQLNITGNRYDLNRTAANLLESVLTTSNVQPSSFGNVGSYTVEGAIFAQPLYLSNVNISGAGTHNVLYVATMHDVVYAFDADHPDVFLWKRDFRGPGVSAATQNYGALLGDALGILSTPVIDIQSNRIFVVAATNEGNSTVYRIHSMDISSGADTVPAVQIEAAASGNSLDFPHDIQRAGLVLSNGQLYIAFSGNPEDTQPYHGWILTYDMNTLQPTGVFLTTIANGGAVWQSGGAPPVDSAENVYFLTGNGFDNKAVDGVSNFSQTLLKMSHHSSSLSLVDWFAPSNWSFLDQFDLDLSCNGPMLIPGTDLIGFGSKNADIYLMHSNALGKLTPNDDHLVQLFHVGAVSLTAPASQYPGIQIGSAPAMATFGSKLYVAFQSNDPSHILFVTSTADGVNFGSPALGIPGISIGSAPSMAGFKNRLYIAFQANDPSNALFITSSADGVNFTTPAQGYPGIQMGSSPAMTVFKNELYIAFQANDPSHALFVTSSPDGVNFTTPATGYPGILLGSAPAMTVLNNRLYISFQANDPGHALFVTSSTDGVNFTTPATGYPGILIGSAPASGEFNQNLFVGFQANDPSHVLWVTSSSQMGNAQIFNDGNRIIGLAYWQRSGSAPLLYAWPGNDTLASFPFEEGAFNTTQARYGNITGNGEPSVAISLSANGEQSGTGVLWAARTPGNRSVGSPGILHAFNAETLEEIWNSTKDPRDTVGALAKFVIPVVANGRVYLATSSNAVQIYGLR